MRPCERSEAIQKKTTRLAGLKRTGSPRDLQPLAMTRAGVLFASSQGWLWPLVHCKSGVGQSRFARDDDRGSLVRQHDERWSGQPPASSMRPCERLQARGTGKHVNNNRPCERLQAAWQSNPASHNPKTVIANDRRACGNPVVSKALNSVVFWIASLRSQLCVASVLE